MGLEIFNELVDIRISHKKAKSLLALLIEKGLCDIGTKDIREFFDEESFSYRSSKSHIQITHIDLDKMSDRKTKILMVMAEYVTTGGIARVRDEEGQVGTILYENGTAYSFGIIPEVKIGSEAEKEEPDSAPLPGDQTADTSVRRDQNAEYWKYAAFQIADTFGTFLAKLGKRKSVTDRDKKAIMFMIVMANHDLKGEYPNYRIKPEEEMKTFENLRNWHATVKASLRKPIP